MSAWGNSAMENDAALKWLEQLFEATDLRRHIEATLALDPEKDAFRIRAAAKVVRLMTDNGTWPQQSAVAIRERAAEALQHVLDARAYANPYATRQVREEMEGLLRETVARRGR